LIQSPFFGRTALNVHAPSQASAMGAARRIDRRWIFGKCFVGPMGSIWLGSVDCSG
jgi:hypothetical protein